MNALVDLELLINGELNLSKVDLLLPPEVII